MKNYLFLIYGNFKNTNQISNVVDIVAQITSSEMLKFKNEDTNILFHFSSEYTQKYILKYLEKNLTKISNTYILSEFTDKTSVIMPDYDINEFLTLSTKQEDIQKYHNSILEPKNGMSFDTILQDLLGIKPLDNDSIDFQMDTWDEFEDEDEDDVNNFILKPSQIKKTKHLNLDDIIDKVINKGRQSLTKEEEDYLKTI
jgi:hypothetical protein